MALFGYEDLPPQFSQYNTQFPGQKEYIGWVWYDTITYTSATTTTATLFNAVRATKDIGNMQVAGQLAAPNAFLILAIKWYVKQRPRSIARAAATAAQTGGIDNVAQLMNTGWLQLTIGQKVYHEAPLWMVASAGGPFGVLALEGATADPGGAADYGVAGVPVPQGYTLGKPVLIGPQISFRVDLTWPAALTLAGGNTDLSIALDGILVRPVQ